MMKVTIITASYNYEDYIKETIESVINQTYKDWEMIIVDDGSKDNSAEIIKKYCKKDERIKLYQHENGANKGLIETIKYALTKTTTDWVIFLESDDTITSNHIEEKIKIINQYPQTDFIFNDINMFGDKDRIEDYRDYFKKQREALKKVKYPTNLKKTFQKTNENLIPTFSCVMLKKDILKNIDFNTPQKPLLDFYLWLQLVNDYNFYYINQKLTNWRMHKNSYITTMTENIKNVYEFNLTRAKFLYGKGNKIIYNYQKFLCLLKYLKKLKQKIISIQIKIHPIKFFKRSKK